MYIIPCFGILFFVFCFLFANTSKQNIIESNKPELDLHYILKNYVSQMLYKEKNNNIPYQEDNNCPLYFSSTDITQIH